MKVLYITFDGLLEPLGSSQIVTPLSALGRRGLDYHVVSLEKPFDLADEQRVRALERSLGEAGVRWSYVPYGEGGGGNIAGNVARLTRLALRVARSRRFDVLHPRAHLSASIAWALGRLTRSPYLFDFRGYWVDEQREQRRWLRRPAAFRAAKLGEARLVRDARALVTLTDLATDDLRRGAIGGRVPGRAVETITTVADYDRFTIDGGTDRVPAEARRTLAGKLVIAYVGAINVSYAVDATLSFFSELRRLRPDAHLLCMTRQGDAMRRLLAGAGIGADTSTIASVPHDDMHEWLRLVDWCFLLLNSPFAKRGSMPTKLAEMFASGVRPLQHGCNTEVSDWVRRAGSGLVLRSLDGPELARAARIVSSTRRERAVLQRARDVTAPHFSLAAGVEKYLAVLETMA